MNKLMLTTAILQMYNGIPQSNGFASAINIGAQHSNNGGIAYSGLEFAQSRASTRSELNSEPSKFEVCKKSFNGCRKIQISKHF